MNRSEEIRAIGGLTGDVLGEAVRIVEGVHGAVSDRVDAALPAPAKPVNAIVRSCTTATYATVRAGHRWIPRGAAFLTAARTPAHSPSMLQGPAATRAVAAVNGIWGDAVTDRVGATTTLGLFRDGKPLPLDVATLVDARPNIVVFVHGMAETEADWNRQPRNTSERRIPYPKRLEADAGAPQDAEFAVAGGAPPDNVHLLQSRPETVWSRRPRRPLAGPRSALQSVVSTLTKEPR